MQMVLALSESTTRSPATGELLRAHGAGQLLAEIGGGAEEQPATLTSAAKAMCFHVALTPNLPTTTNPTPHPNHTAGGPDVYRLASGFPSHTVRKPAELPNGSRRMRKGGQASAGATS
jgi:hypothetical protein